MDSGLPIFSRYPLGQKPKFTLAEFSLSFDIRLATETNIVPQYVATGCHVRVVANQVEWMNRVEQVPHREKIKAAWRCFKKSGGRGGI